MLRVNTPFICIVQDDVASPKGWAVTTEAGVSCFVTFTKKTKAMRGDRIYVTPSKIEGDAVKALYDAKLGSLEEAVQCEARIAIEWSLKMKQLTA